MRIDSRVVVGAVAKGRSGSTRLNELVRQIHCMCFAGGLALQLIYIPSEHNPSDFPSRGQRLPGRRPRRTAVQRCPACGALPADHPLDRPRALRGGLLMCRGIGMRFAYVDGTWVADFQLSEMRRYDVLRSRRLLDCCFWAWAAFGFLNARAEYPVGVDLVFLLRSVFRCGVGWRGLRGLG